MNEGLVSVLYNEHLKGHLTWSYRPPCFIKELCCSWEKLQTISLLSVLEEMSDGSQRDLKKLCEPWVALTLFMCSIFLCFLFSLIHVSCSNLGVIFGVSESEDSAASVLGKASAFAFRAARLTARSCFRLSLFVTSSLSSAAFSCVYCSLAAFNLVQSSTCKKSKHLARLYVAVASTDIADWSKQSNLSNFLKWLWTHGMSKALLK